MLPRRPDLRIILMSATMNAAAFASYFGGCPVTTIPGFTHPVKVCPDVARYNGARARA